jgi:hypothetical protein
MAKRQPPRVLPAVQYNPPPEDVEAVSRNPGAGMGDYSGQLGVLGAISDPRMLAAQLGADIGQRVAPSVYGAAGTQTNPAMLAAQAGTNFGAQIASNWLPQGQGSAPSGMGQPNIPQNQFDWTMPGQADPNGTGGVGQSGVPQWGPLTSGYTQSPQFLGRPDPTGIDGTGQSSVPQWGPLQGGYVQSPAFLQGRAAGATGALPNQQEQINDWYPQGQPDPKGTNGMGQPSIPQGGTKVQYSPTSDATTPPVAGPGNAETTTQWQNTLDKNQNLTQQAKDAGNDKELARLQAEWDRIAPMAQKYGLTPERLINSYMQPDNPAAEPDFQRAAARAIADDTWGNAATIAFGRPPNTLEWDEHWRAMNKGGRDPLEGHPAAVQAIQARMQEIQKDNQTQAFNAYQQWAATQQ